MELLVHKGGPVRFPTGPFADEGPASFTMGRPGKPHPGGLQSDLCVRQAPDGTFYLACQMNQSPWFKPSRTAIALFRAQTLEGPFEPVTGESGHISRPTPWDENDASLDPLGQPLDFLGKETPTIAFTATGEMILIYCAYPHRTPLTGTKGIYCFHMQRAWPPYTEWSDPIMVMGPTHEWMVAALRTDKESGRVQSKGGLMECTLLIMNEQLAYLWFTAVTNDTRFKGEAIHKTGFATCLREHSNFEAWLPQPNPVSLPVGAGQIEVIQHDGGYLGCCSFKGGLNLVSSRHPTSGWEWFEENPVIVPAANTPYSQWIRAGSLTVHDGRLHLFAHCQAQGENQRSFHRFSAPLPS